MFKGLGDFQISDGEDTAIFVANDRFVAKTLQVLFASQYLEPVLRIDKY